MNISGKYRLREIGRHEWRKLGSTLRLDPDGIVQRIREMAQRIPDLSSSLRLQMRGLGLAHEALDRLAAMVAARAGECAASLA